MPARLSFFKFIHNYWEQFHCMRKILDVYCCFCSKIPSLSNITLFGSATLIPWIVQSTWKLLPVNTVISFLTILPLVWNSVKSNKENKISERDKTRNVSLVVASRETDRSVRVVTRHWVTWRDVIGCGGSRDWRGVMGLVTRLWRRRNTQR